MIKIKSITIKNFRSYGDYETTLNFNSMGPVLVVGQTGDNDRRSNGAGKSSILDAIVWVLFDRLPSKDRPAKNVVNWNTGKNCLVKLTTEDGYEITRTREYDGHNDLLIHTPSGEDITDSTNKNAQQHLLKIFNLDYEIFMSSVFFGQFGRPFLELPDPKRKKAMERMLHLTKFDHYAAVAKEKHVSAELEQTKHIGELESVKQGILASTQRLDQLTNTRAQFESTREERIKTKLDEIPVMIQEHEQKVQALKDEIVRVKNEQAGIKTYDLIGLKNEWEQFEKDLAGIDAEIATLSRYDKKVQELQERKSKAVVVDEATLKEHQQKLIRDAEIMGETLAKLTEVDLIKLQEEWDRHDKSKDAQAGIQSKIAQIDGEIVNIRVKMDTLLEQKGEWHKRVGICPSCKQVVSKDYTQKMVDDLQTKIDNLKKTLDDRTEQQNGLQDEYKKAAIQAPSKTMAEARLMNGQIQEKRAILKRINDDITGTRTKMATLAEERQRNDELIRKIDTAIEMVESKKKEREHELSLKRAAHVLKRPTLTLKEAELVNEKHRNKTEVIKGLNIRIAELGRNREKETTRITKEAERMRSEANPYDELLASLRKEIDDAKEKRQALDKKVGQYNLLLKHLEYIRSAYSDRRKIKSYILSRLIPYFNERIKFYLEELDCRYDIEFNAFLQTKSDRWPYELWSGGERKRIDLAVMFAMHDLHKSLYDQRCNILVFDEVDGKLDPDGVNAFVNLVLRDFDERSGMDAVLVISHKDEMRDFFPTKIAVKKVDDYSRIEEIR